VATTSRPEQFDQAVSKNAVLDLMRRLGRTDDLPDAEHSLPDPVWLDRDAALLMRFGLSRDKAIEALGGSL
jgi:hypothetical protein